MKTIVCVLAAASLTVSAAAYCSPGVFIGRVKNIYVLQDGKVLFHKRPSDNPEYTTLNEAPCAANPNAFVFDSTSELGKSRLTLLMAAWERGRDMYIVGNDTCTLLPGSGEDLRFFSIHEP